MNEDLNNKTTEDSVQKPVVEKVSAESINSEKDVEDRETAFVALDNIIKSFLELSDKEKKAVIELIKSGKIKI